MVIFLHLNHYIFQNSSYNEDKELKVEGLLPGKLYSCIGTIWYEEDKIGLITSEIKTKTKSLQFQLESAKAHSLTISIDQYAKELVIFYTKTAGVNLCAHFCIANF